MSVKVQRITEPLEHGEGPHWDAQQQALFFVDVYSKFIHKFVPATGKHTRTKLGGRVGFIVPVEGTTDQFLIGLRRKFVIVKWDGEDGTPATVVKEIAEVDQDVVTTSINDGKADPRGRVYAGTFADLETPDPSETFENPRGSLFRLDGGKVTKIGDRIRIANGLAWDLKEKAMYYIDSMERNIRRYDYDVETGEVSNMRHVFDLVKNNMPGGIPDGCTIDTDGNLWVATFSESCVLNIDPRTGTLIRKITIPVPQVTSVTFGGPDHDILFVTTSNVKYPELPKPPSGAVFMVTGLGVKGHPNVHYKL